MDKLPKFRRPPLIEVLHGVQFRQLPLTIAHPGLFHLRVQDEFPTAQTMPPISGVRETFGPPLAYQPFRFEMMPPNELPRAWFVSADDAMLIQLQRDRLNLNWRKGTGDREYPHFEEVSAKFEQVFLLLFEFCEEKNIGSIEIDHCEMTYVNHVARVAEGSELPTPADFFRPWTGALGQEWETPLEDLSFNARFVLRNSSDEPHGRLTGAFSTLYLPQTRERVLQLEITVRGTPDGTNLSSALAFHAMAHENIVRFFTAVTTPQKHDEWERYQ